MKIQQIQNNNTNFKGIHYEKKLRKLLTPEVLEQTGIKECGDKFDVLITSEPIKEYTRYGSRIIDEIYVRVGEMIDSCIAPEPELMGVLGDRYTLKELLHDGRLLKTNFDRKIAKKCSGYDGTKITGKQKEMLDKIDAVISEISARSTTLGAAQNRIESAIESIGVQSENLTSSLSTIRDADVASESSTYIKAQILQQASATLLAAANQSPSIALNLI